MVNALLQFSSIKREDRSPHDRIFTVLVTGVKIITC